MNFNPYSPTTLFAIYCVSEFLVVRFKFSGKYSETKDRGSLYLLMFIFVASLGLARFVKIHFPQADLESLTHIALPGVLLFFAGLIIRWASIIHLGRFFTIDVAIDAKHTLIDTGPYRYVRHPSYTGLLLQFLGIGICSANILALLALMVPIFIALRYRIGVEEAALSEGLGAAYAEYMRKTKRLFPFVY
ncbi:methyltransferase family protein [Undibacterium sp. TJN25]|uniref:methyltransferase family protein n=1 Tax=Undibacterium sp. TJN25 TaxID=3413056 RepID=UPI003BEFF95E